MTPPSAIATHVEAAKRLLVELEEQSLTAFQALGRDSGDEFLAAVDARDRILTELNGVIESLAHDGPAVQAPDTQSRAQVNSMLDDMARVAARALESHQELMARTQLERNRLAAALTRSERPDGVADRYAANARAPHTRTLSISG
jgi:hypothetical protein